MLLINGGFSLTECIQFKQYLTDESFAEALLAAHVIYALLWKYTFLSYTGDDCYLLLNWVHLPLKHLARMQKQQFLQVLHVNMCPHCGV